MHRFSGGRAVSVLCLRVDTVVSVFPMPRNLNPVVVRVSLTEEVPFMDT